MGYRKTIVDYGLCESKKIVSFNKCGFKKTMSASHNDKHISFVSLIFFLCAKGTYQMHILDHDHPS
jgi:hypothetical protein